MTRVLDGRAMTDRAAAHAHIKAVLELPEHYGRNLDALYDMLTERAQPTKVILKNADCMKTRLGQYAAALIDTLIQAAAKNPALEVKIEDE